MSNALFICAPIVADNPLLLQLLLPTDEKLGQKQSEFMYEMKCCNWLVEILGAEVNKRCVDFHFYGSVNN